MPLFFLSSLHVYHGMCIPVLPQRQDLRGIRGGIKLHGKPICNSKIIKYIENREDIFKESEVFSWMYQIQVSSYSFLNHLHLGEAAGSRIIKVYPLSKCKYRGVAKPLFHHCCKYVIINSHCQYHCFIFCFFFKEYQVLVFSNFLLIFTQFILCVDI